MLLMADTWIHLVPLYLYHDAETGQRLHVFLANWTSRKQMLLSKTELTCGGLIIHVLSQDFQAFLRRMLVMISRTPHVPDVSRRQG